MTVSHSPAPSPTPSPTPAAKLHRSAETAGADRCLGAPLQSRGKEGGA